MQSMRDAVPKASLVEFPVEMQPEKDRESRDPETIQKFTATAMAPVTSEFASIVLPSTTSSPDHLLSFPLLFDPIISLRLIIPNFITGYVRLG